MAIAEDAGLSRLFSRTSAPPRSPKLARHDSTAGCCRRAALNAGAPESTCWPAVRLIRLLPCYEAVTFTCRSVLDVAASGKPPVGAIAGPTLADGTGVHVGRAGTAAGSRHAVGRGDQSVLGPPVPAFAVDLWIGPMPLALGFTGIWGVLRSPSPATGSNSGPARCSGTHRRQGNG